MLSWLPRISFQKVYEGNYDDHLEGTGHWLFASEEYRSWREGDTSALLWIKGKNGSGKSVLASLVVNRFQKESESKTAAAFVFCTRLEEKKNAPKDLLMSILRQLSVQNKFEIDEYLEQVYDRKSELQLEGPTWQETEEAIMSIVSNFTKVFIVFDGMDECQEYDKISGFLLSLSQSTSAAVKVLITSRPGYPSLEDIFASCPQLPIDSGSNDQDIRRFITSNLHLGKIAVRDEEALRAMEEKLFSKAEGMFLYVTLSIKSLQGPGTANQIQRKLHLIPTGLDKVYELSMKRIFDEEDGERRQLALRLLLWVANAKRRLSRNEVLEAIVLKPGANILDQDDKIANDQGLTTLCGDLVRLDRDECFYLVHGSLKDYLFSLSIDTTSPLKQYQLMQDEAHSIIGEICLTYLLFEDFKNILIADTEHIKTLFKKYPLLQYAAQYWGHHIASTAESKLEELVVNLIESVPQRELALQSYHGKYFPHGGITNCLHLVSIFSLVRTANTLQDIHLLWDQRDGFELCPLDYALLAESKDMCLWILDSVKALRPCVTNIEAKSAPVHMAAVKGWEDVVDLLINLGFDPEKEAGQHRSTPLALATTCRSTSVVKRLLKSKVNVNCIEADGQTPLVEAALQNQMEIIALLIEAGVDVNIRGRDGSTALFNAVYHENKDLIEMLLDRDADITSEAKLGDYLRFTPLHLAAAKNSHAIIRMFKCKGIDNIDVRTEDQFTALHYAAIKNSLLAMELLVSLGARIDVQNLDGETPLRLAAQNGHLEAVRYLLGVGLMASKFPDVNEITPAIHAVSVDGQIQSQPPLNTRFTVEVWRRDKDIALRLAAQNGHAEIVTVLLAEGANHESIAELGSSPLHLAGYNDHAGLVRVLLDAGADSTVGGKYQSTALHIAAARGKTGFVQELLAAVSKIDINQRNHWNETPLHCAAKNGHSETVQLLLRQRAVVSRDIDQNLPLHLAAANGYEVVVSQFLEEDINVSGFFGRTALWSAACYGHVKIVQLLLGIHGINIDASDNNSCTPLLISLFNGHTEIAHLLINKGADANTPSDLGHTPLHAAAIIGSEEISKKLLDMGCNGLARSQDGQTPFLRAVWSDSIRIVDMLFEKGFDGSKISDQRGYTCIHAAAEHGNIEVLQKLRALGTIPLEHTVSGHNAVYFAACKGQLETINWLIGWQRGLKVEFEEFEANAESSLCGAASHGCFTVVQRLIELGADVEKQSNYAGMNPLIYAAAYGLPKTVRQLVSANADPFRLNAYGLSALDYAARHPLTFHQLIQSNSRYQPMDPARREDHLRKTIWRCVQSILALPRLLKPKEEYDKYILVLTLGYSLIYISEANHEEAKMCFMELSLASNRPMFSLDAECFTCHHKLWCMDHYVCTQCLHVMLCKSCLSKYVIGGGSPNSAPKGFEVMQELENELLEVRRAVRRVLSFGAESIARIYTHMGMMKQWLKEKVEAYESWEKAYNSGGEYKSYERPGQEFVQLIYETNVAIKDLEGHRLPAHELESIFAPMNRRMADLFKKYNVDVDAKNFICSGHTYLHISKNEWEQIKSTGDVFDSQDKLKTEWLMTLLDKYRSEEDNTNMEYEETTAHKRSTMQIKGHKVAKIHGESLGADLALKDGGVKRTGKQHNLQQGSETATRNWADPASSVNKLAVRSQKMIAEATASTHLQTPATTSSTEKNSSQDHSKNNNRAHYEDDGGGSSHVENEREPTISYIAEEILPMFRSRTSVHERESERAVLQLPILETILRLADMIQPGSSETLLCDYRQRCETIACGISERKKGPEAPVGDEAKRSPGLNNV